VQEQSLALGSDVGLAVNSYHYSTNAPSGTFSIHQNSSLPAGDGLPPLSFRDFAFTNLTVAAL